MQVGDGSPASLEVAVKREEAMDQKASPQDPGRYHGQFWLGLNQIDDVGDRGYQIDTQGGEIEGGIH